MPGPAENPVARTTATTSKGMEPENEPRSCHHQLAVHTQEGTPEVRLQQKHNHAVKALVGENQGRKAFSTRSAYECYLKLWILPRWGNHRLDQIKPVAVEEWLDSIERAKGTKAKIRNLMSAVFSSRNALRVGWQQPNQARAPERETRESA